MSFVGTRPEAVRYVEKYKPEYYAMLTQTVVPNEIVIVKDGKLTRELDEVITKKDFGINKWMLCKEIF